MGTRRLSGAVAFPGGSHYSRENPFPEDWGPIDHEPRDGSAERWTQQGGCMKKVAMFAVLALSLFAISAVAAEWTGAISEAGCGLKHANGGGEKCVTSCVKRGAAPVFVTDGKVIKIANADKVMDHLGKKVVVNGKLDGDTVTIDTIKNAE